MILAQLLEPEVPRNVLERKGVIANAETMGRSSGSGRSCRRRGRDPGAAQEARDVAAKKQCGWMSLGASLVFTLAALAGCQAMGQPQGSILGACANPRPSNRDWCLSAQYPNAGR